MGASESTEKLGQRVVVAKATLDKDLKSAQDRFDFLKQQSPQTLSTMLQSVADSFSTCSPFLESTLLVAWLFDANKCKEILLKACKKVLRAPINNDEYDWFKAYVFTSNIWMQKTADTGGKYMYEELFDVCNSMSSDIVTTMDSIFEHLKSHKQWQQVTAIKNETLISRQDHKSVGLLTEKGLSKVFEMKSDQEQSEDMKNFIDSNMAINMLTSTASKIDREFQHHMKLAMSSHGTYKPAPMKKVERSISKCENDYAHESFPKSAKLLDLVRCSVTFNTVEQLCKGVAHFMEHMNYKPNKSILELARVKNGFIDSAERSGGYRDIKVNVVFKSQNPEHANVRMICEVQFLLINYLEEKKKIHKLYSILREETFFKMVVSQPKEKGPAKDIRELQFEEVLNVGKEVSLSLTDARVSKCSVDPESGLLGMEAESFFGVVDMKTKKEVWAMKRVNGSSSDGYFGMQTHAWLTINGQKYLSVQTDRNKIQMFKVTAGKANSYKFEKDKNYQIIHSSDQGNKATINYCDFDEDFEHIFLVTDYGVLQKRAVKDIQNVISRIELKERVSGSAYRNFRLSADGRFCTLGGGGKKSYFYVINIESGEQIRLKSTYLEDTFVPCFINGATQFIALGDMGGRIEVWDIQKKESVKQIEIETGGRGIISSSTSSHNILAIGSMDNNLRLYDVRNWECFYKKRFECKGNSLHLTEDMRYVTFAGYDPKKTDRCVVLGIK